jgi:methylmalonyl-CoA mutase cobalamin-binding subunit
VSLVFRLFGAMGIAVSHSPEEIVSVAIAVAVLSVIFSNLLKNYLSECKEILSGMNLID